MENLKNNEQIESSDEMLKAEERGYSLTKEEFQRSVGMAELRILLNAKPAINRPKSIYIIAQPGAGKTGLRKYVELEQQRTQMGGETFVEIDPDEVAIYHKFYNEIMQKYPNDSYKKVQEFVKPALDDYLRPRAVQLGNNLIQEGTFRSEDYIKILEFQKKGGMANIGKVKPDGEREKVFVKGGYDIEINLLAVDRFESLLSSYEREQDFIDYNLAPRTVVPEHHDAAYFEMIERVRQIEEKRLYDRIKVFKRGYSEGMPELIYVSGDGRFPSAYQCITETRVKERKNLLANPEPYLKRMESLKERAESETLITKIASLEQEFMQCLEKDKESKNI